MINNVASNFQVDLRLQCMLNCTLSPICDSYNYRPSDKTCELNTHDTKHTLDSCVHADSGLVPLIRHASSTHTTLRWSPTRPILSMMVPGAGGVASSRTSSKLDTNLISHFVACVVSGTENEHYNEGRYCAKCLWHVAVFGTRFRMHFSVYEFT